MKNLNNQSGVIHCLRKMSCELYLQRNFTQYLDAFANRAGSVLPLHLYQALPMHLDDAALFPLDHLPGLHCPWPSSIVRQSRLEVITTKGRLTSSMVVAPLR